MGTTDSGILWDVRVEDNSVIAFAGDEFLSKDEDGRPLWIFHGLFNFEGDAPPAYGTLRIIEGEDELSHRSEFSRPHG